MHENIQAAIEPAINAFGFEVNRDKDAIGIYWSLYTQGGGVAFDGTLVDTKLLFKRMQSKEELAAVARVAPLFASEDIRVLVKQGRGSYTHGGTMDIEVQGPHNGSPDGDYDADGEAIEVMSKSLREMLHSISEKLLPLVESYDLLTCQEDGEVLWEFETQRFRVEVTQLRDMYGQLLNDHLEGFEANEGLEEMRRLTKKFGEFAASDVQIAIYLRDEDDEEEWIRLYRKKVSGGVYRKSDVHKFVMGFREEIQEGIKKIRSINRTLKPDMKEAA